MAEFNEKLIADQEYLITSYTDSASTGDILALPTSAKSNIRLTNGSITSLRGIANGGPGKMLYLRNVSGAPFTVVDQTSDGGVAAGDKIITGLAANITLLNNQSLVLMYDSINSKWCVKAASVAGAQGAQGSQGAQGLQGSTGAQGAQGFQGLQGSTGAQGAQGFQGLQGSTGAQGAQGFQGLQGTTGAQGSQGFQGVPGTVPTTATNDATNNTYVGSGQYPSLSGASATNGQSSSATFNTDALIFVVTVGTERACIVCVADYFSTAITAISDIGNLFNIADGGTGIYISKPSNSRVLTVKNNTGGTEVILVQAINAALSSVTAWA